MSEILRNEVCQIALEYAAAGLSIIPLRVDGSKLPSIPVWDEYHDRIATPDEIRGWFNSRLCGIGIVTGAVSGGLEVLDFNQPECFEPWRHLTTGIIERLTVIETASGGFHVLYRCREICGNFKIAKWEAPESLAFMESGSRRHCDNQVVSSTRIETQGQGGYIVAVGSPVSVHPSGKCYAQVLGQPLPTVPAISPTDRRALWHTAAEFDCRINVTARVERMNQENRLAVSTAPAAKKEGAV